MTSEQSDPNSNPNKKKNFLKIFKNHFKKKNTIFSSADYEKLDVPRQDMIRGVFELSNENARDIMIPRVDVIAVDSKTELKPLVKIITEAGHSRVPVFEDTVDNIAGILYVKDLINLLVDRSKKKFSLKKILHEPFFVPETMPLDELLLEFKNKKLHIAIVVDEYGGVSGIVTLEDILEEIVGDISDEYDVEEKPEIEQKSKNIFEVDSRMTLTDFNTQMNLDLPTEEFDTIGGYVFDLFGKIPDQNEEIQDKNMTFKIKDIKGTVINRIIVSINRKKNVKK